MLHIKLGVLLAALALITFMSLLFGAPPGVVFAITLFIGIIVPSAATNPVKKAIDVLGRAWKASPLSIVLGTVLLFGLVALVASHVAAPYEVGWMAIGFIVLSGLYGTRGSTSLWLRRHLEFFNGRHLAVPIG